MLSKISYFFTFQLNNTHIKYIRTKKKKKKEKLNILFQLTAHLFWNYSLGKTNFKNSL